MTVIDLLRKPEHSSRIHPGLDRKPGDSNWVDKAGGLPSYIERIAKHIHYDSGLSISHAIAAAVERVKKLAAKGNPQAVKALAEWVAKRAKARALSGEDGLLYEEVYDLIGGDIHPSQRRRALFSTYGNSTSAQTTGVKGSAFSEGKHNRDTGGRFAQKISPVELAAARRKIEGDIIALRVGQTIQLPNKLGWVKRTPGGYMVQGNGGFVASVRTSSEAITAAAALLVKKGLKN